jgi:hypothetical protein
MVNFHYYAATQHECRSYCLTPDCNVFYFISAAAMRQLLAVLVLLVSMPFNIDLKRAGDIFNVVVS